MARYVRDGDVVDLWFGNFDNWNARRDYAARSRELMHAGYQRVRDPAREADVDTEFYEPALEAQLRAQPDDVATRLVYADWLQQQDHPRGALIAGDLTMLEEHADILLGPLETAVRPPPDARLELVWDHGFIRAARIDGFWDTGESEDLLWELLRHPSARVMRELVIGCHHAGDQNNELMADILLRSGPTVPLRKLYLADFDDSDINNIDISRAPLGDLTGLGQRYPKLEDVILKGRGDVELGPLSLPRAKRFAIRTSTLTKGVIDSIIHAPWDALEELELWFGDDEYGGDCTRNDAVRVLFTDFPKLRTLRLMNAPFTDELVRSVSTSRLCPQLTAIDFGLGTLTDAGASELADRASELRHIAFIGVAENCLTERGLARLREVGLPIDTHPAAIARTYRSGKQKSRRYVSVTE